MFWKYVPKYEQKKEKKPRILTPCEDAEFSVIGGVCREGYSGQMCDHIFSCKNFRARHCRRVRK